jgi:hypothetical protein
MHRVYRFKYIYTCTFDTHSLQQLGVALLAEAACSINAARSMRSAGGTD